MKQSIKRACIAALLAAFTASSQVAAGPDNQGRGVDSKVVEIRHASLDTALPSEREKQIRGEVFVMTNAGPWSERVQCKEYQVFLLKDLAPGGKGELLLTAKQSRFELTLSAQQCSTYAYLEFVSPAGSKTIKLEDVADGDVEIVLDRQMIVKKPAIYMYPMKRTTITVVHLFKGQLLNTYPQYIDNWTVVADTDGTLWNLRDQRSYKYLFWDGAYSFPKEHYQFTNGFYVKSEDYVSFLQDKLTKIGLNDNEINDFIVYWLPVMNKYPQCFVHFRINDNIDGSSVLTTQPAADTVIRVFMEFAGLDKSANDRRLPEQTLPSIARTGFTLVEWGGAEIGDSKIE